MNSSPPTFADAMLRYLEYLEHEQGASRTARAGYQAGLRRFLRFLTGRQAEEPTLLQVSADDVRSYLYTLSRQGLRPRTLRGAIYPLRGLFALAVARGWRSDDPARAVKLPRKDAAVRETINDEDLEQLLAGCDREPDPVRRPMRKAVLAVLIYSAVRRQELLDLQVADVDLKERKLLVRSGKGAKSRAIYLCQAAVEAIREWLAVRPVAKHPYLFSTDVRRRMGEVGLRKLVEEAKALADLRDRAHIKPHSIRHAAATRLMRNGADIRSIQQFLGHSQLQTTAVYLHTDERQLQRISELQAFAAESTPRATLPVQPGRSVPHEHRGRTSSRHPSSDRVHRAAPEGSRRRSSRRV